MDDYVEPDFAARRAEMVEHQLRERGIRDERVLAAMGEVPRELFVPDRRRELAYADAALPIGAEQTISQPWIVAAMPGLPRASCTLASRDSSARRACARAAG